MCLPFPPRSADDTEAVAVDGKSVRGAATDGQAAPHLLAFCTHETQETLLHVRVSDKINEIPVAQAVASRLQWQGRALTADALRLLLGLFTSSAMPGDG